MPQQACWDVKFEQNRLKKLSCPVCCCLACCCSLLNSCTKGSRQTCKGTASKLWH